MVELPKDTRIAYRDHLRDARARAFCDAEGFQEVLYAIKHLGTALLGKASTLNAYAEKLRRLAAKSPLAFCLSSKFRHLYTPFDVLYRIVRVARNDALHQGAYARHITAHTVELSIVLEDALTNDCTTVADFMVKIVIQAELWQPLAFLRQQMLTSSFSYLPLLIQGRGWRLISDRSLASALRRTDGKREDSLGMTLRKAIADGIIDPPEATLVNPDVEIDVALGLMNNRPVLVQHPDNPDQIIGIVTAFDLM
jgi:predicted transcriptional regulator